MKVLLILAAVIGSFAVVEPTATKENHGMFGLEPLVEGLKTTLGGHLERHVKAALAGVKLDENNELLAKQLGVLEGVPFLPPHVAVKINLTDVKYSGLADLVPTVQLDLIRLSLKANYKLPEFRLQGGYELELTSNFNPEDPESYTWLVAAGDSAAASVSFTDLELDVAAKLKWTLLGGFKVDTLDYTLGEFRSPVSFPKLIVGGLVDISPLTDAVLSHILHSELAQFEEKAHEPLVTALREFIDFLLSGGGLIP